MSVPLRKSVVLAAGICALASMTFFCWSLVPRAAQPDVQTAESSPGSNAKGAILKSPIAVIEPAPEPAMSDTQQVAANAAMDPNVPSRSYPLPAVIPTPEEDDAWHASFEKATISEIEAATDALLADVDRLSGPTLDAMFNSGQREFLGLQNQVVGGVDNLEVSRIYMISGGGTYKVTLPAEKYPEVYALKARAVWLAYLSHARRSHTTQVVNK